MDNKPDIALVESSINGAENLEEIGSGGYKVVYKAHINGRIEALKLVYIPSDDGNEEESLPNENFLRIKREINILSQIDTPSMVKLRTIEPYEIEIDSNKYLVYSEEYLEGKALNELIKNKYSPTITDLVELGLCLVDSISAMSKLHIIHRDIKPENVIKTSNNNRKYVLLDLGIAFHIGGTSITQNHQAIPGTLYYIAPEMLKHNFRQNMDYRSDLYAAGLTLYEYASGINPFKSPSDTVYDIFYRIKEKTPKSLMSLRIDLPGEFCSLIDQLLKRMPSLRPANLTAIKSQLEKLL